MLTRLRRAIRPERFLEPRPLAATLIATVTMAPVAGVIQLSGMLS
ncbi:MAG: hypothetical protein ACRDSH_15200 [Pseudonocardiaceae bacterium]